MELVEATDGQKEARDRLAHAAWGDRLTVAQFIARETRLRATAWAKSAMRTWLLVDGSAVLSSLETFAVRSRFGDATGTSYEIASVYTEPELRGRGYATALVDAVVAALPGAQAFTLYSDIGAALYARVGFVPRPALELVLPARPTSLRVERLITGEPFSPRGAFALIADAAQLDWHRERERAYAALLGRAALPHGLVRVPGGAALIAGDLKHDRLLVLDLRADDDDAREQLYAAAADEASRAGLREVVAWVDPGTRGAQPRDGALPMIRPCLPGLAAHDWADIPRLLWV